MSKIAVMVVKAGGSKQLVELEASASSLADLRSQLQIGENQLATVNGDTQDADYDLSEGDYVTFTEQVKGAAGKKATKKATRKPRKAKKA